ncbi:MAG: hypothetical protein QM777_10705 [Pseudorhodoferax sp.]
MAPATCAGMAGHEVTVYNRSAAKAQAWCGELPGPQRRHPARGRGRRRAGVLLRGQRRRPALGGAGANSAFAGMARDAVFVDHTTASANVARELYTAARAPVSLRQRDSPAARPARRTAR